MTLAEPRRIHVSAAVISYAGGRLLIVRKSGTTAFMQPGGKPEAGEDAAMTLVREIREELGLRLNAADLAPLGTFAAAAANEPGFEVVAEVFAADIRDQTPVASAEIAELRWVGPGEIDQLEIAPLAREYFLR